MKRLIKALMKSVWNALAPIRRPIVRRIDAKLERLVARAVQSQFPASTAESLHHANQALFRVEYSLGVLHSTADRQSTEIDLVLNSLVREIARLQNQFEEFQHAIDLASSRSGGLSLLALDDEISPAVKAG